MHDRFSTRSVGGGFAPRPPEKKPAFRWRPPAGSGWKEAVMTALTRIRLFFRPEGSSRREMALRIAGVIGGLGIVYTLFLWFTLPKIDEQTIGRAAQSTVITDRNGVELYRLFGEEDRTYIPGTDIPDSVKHAVVAIEDERFYDRGCIDLRALARVAIHLGKSGGASTITRQLARNALDLKNDNVINRKLKELVLGCQLEHSYEKDKILELYLNWIPFGQNAYGVEQASRRYFGKSAKEVTLTEAAVLAGLPQLPSYYSPYGRHVRTTVSERAMKGILDGDITSADDLSDSDVSIGLLGAQVGTGSKTIYVGGRTDQVLHNMEAQGFITEEARIQAVKEMETIAFKPARESIRAPHFVLWTKDLLEKAFTDGEEQSILEQGGLTVQTTLDWRLQQAAEEIVAKHREDIQKRFMGQNIALVAVDPVTREVLAYVGNADYADDEHGGKIDMVHVPRQPGSSFKPFVYAAAFLEGYSPATVLYDVPTKFGDFEPQNYEGGFRGLMTARTALGGSRNIPAVKAYFLGGEEQKILALVDAMGMPTPGKNVPAAGYGPAMAIGAAETPLYEMVQGYATFANAGKAKDLVSVLKITDRRGNLLPLPPSEDETEALDPRVAYQVTSILSDASARPDEYWRSVLSVPGFAAAAKTGTSNKCLERAADGNACIKRNPDNVWTLGYTPSLVTGVWVGNATSDALSSTADGLTVAAPMWKEFMIKAHAILKETPDGEPRTLATNFTAPSGIVEPQISLLSGELPTECTPVQYRRGDIFLQENAPTLADPGCARLLVDKVTGLLASDECPVEAQEERSFIVPVSVLESRFPQWKAAIIAWMQPRGPKIGEDGQIIEGTGGTLPFGMAPTEKCSIALTPGRQVKPTLTIDSPTSGGSAAYPSFRPDLDFSVGSKVRQIVYDIDGKTVATHVSEPFGGAIRVPRSIPESGMHTLTVTLTDEYYNVVSDSVRFTFEEDVSGPRVYLTSPVDGADVETATDILIRAEASDTEGSLKYVEFYLDDLLLTRKPRDPYEILYKPPVITPGAHEIRAVATDEAGNVMEDTVRIMIVEPNASGSGATEEVEQ